MVEAASAERAVRAPIGSCSPHRPRRRSRTSGSAEVTLFKSVGLAVEDIVATKPFFDRAPYLGIGLELEVPSPGLTGCHRSTLRGMSFANVCVAVGLAVMTSAMTSAAEQSQHDGAHKGPSAKPFERLFRATPLTPPKTNADVKAPAFDVNALVKLKARLNGVLREQRQAEFDCASSRAVPADPAIDSVMRRPVPRAPRAAARALSLPRACRAVAGP